MQVMSKNVQKNRPTGYRGHEGSKKKQGGCCEKRVRMQKKSVICARSLLVSRQTENFTTLTATGCHFFQGKKEFGEKFLSHFPFFILR